MVKMMGYRRSRVFAMLRGGGNGLWVVTEEQRRSILLSLGILRPVRINKSIGLFLLFLFKFFCIC